MVKLMVEVFPLDGFMYVYMPILSRHRLFSDMIFSKILPFLFASLYDVETVKVTD